MEHLTPFSHRRRTQTRPHRLSQRLSLRTEVSFIFQSIHSYDVELNSSRRAGVLFAHNGTSTAIADSTGAICISPDSNSSFEVVSGEHKHCPSDMSFLTSTSLITTQANRCVVVDASSGHTQHLYGHEETVRSVSFLESTPCVGVSSCRKGKICLWDLRMNAKSIHDKALSPVRPGSLGFTPIGMLQDTWACGCGQEYNTKTQSTLQLFDDHHNVKRKLKLCPGTRSPPAVASSGQLPVSTTGVKLSPCGTFVYSVGSDSALKVWDMRMCWRRPKPLTTISLKQGNAGGAAMNLSMDAEGEHLAINIKGKHLVHVAHPSSLEPRVEILEAPDTPRFGFPAYISRDGSTIGCGSAFGAVSVYQTGRVTSCVSTYEPGTTCSSAVFCAPVRKGNKLQFYTSWASPSHTKLFKAR